ncbi:hypothetical protein K470DRAFT_216428 [Piedraia hortae CBS 480.64]|uniref:TMEM205-like domain-containing protein n=1 Tax=Piedraia hortae CBS 480.64 TaxID=1314780 RepID=A0A6A7BZP8_9PEZI|nr:hypothetical protein K470DRAFT_216428 [Piedraia hortae CBS 480.64]
MDTKPYHIIAYGTLLGSSVFQTFIGGPLAFKALPRAQFSTLQQAIFPTFFSLQTALPILLALTWPGERVASMGQVAARYNVGYKGLLENNKALGTIGIMFGTALLNLVVLGPATTKVMKERKHQETRDGKRYYDPGPHSEEMEHLNSAFSKLHGASSLTDVVGLGAMVFYAFIMSDL